MGATVTANLITPSVYNEYFIEKTAEKTALLSSGVAIRNEDFDKKASAEGSTVDLPFLQDLSGEEEIMVDNVSATINALSSAQDKAARQVRIKAWGASQLSAMISGADPLGAIASLSADYWARRQQASLISTLTGIFATTLASTHVNDIAIEDGDNATSSALVSGDAIIDTMTKLGDVASNLSAIVCHSQVYSRLQKQQLITTIRDADNNVLFQTYLDKRIIVDDTCPVVAGSSSGYKYSTFLFAPGSVSMGLGNIPHMLEDYRDGLASTDAIITRSAWIMHPSGVKWTGTPAVGLFPTNTELATGSNWSKVYETKNVRILELITNG